MPRRKSYRWSPLDEGNLSLHSPLNTFMVTMRVKINNIFMLNMISIQKLGRKLQKPTLPLIGRFDLDEFFFTFSFMSMVFLFFKFLDIVYNLSQGIRKGAHEIKKFNDYPNLLSRGGYDLFEKNLMEEKRKR